MPLRSPRHLRRSVVGGVVALCGVVAVGACGADDAPDAGAFCEMADENASAIVAPAIASSADVEQTLSLYRDLGELAPLSIATEWNDLVDNLETASTVVPDDPESMQRMAAKAYATERSAVAVHDWLLTHCQIDLGPVTTITPQDPAPPPAGTAPTRTVPPGG